MTTIRTALMALTALLLSYAGAAAQSLQALPFSYLSTASTNSTLIDGSGQNVLKWMVATNTSTTTTYFLKIYDKKTAPVCGTDVPKLRIPLLPNVNGGGQSIVGFDDTRFTQGIGFCLTGALADNDTSNAATGIVLNFGYLWQ